MELPIDIIIRVDAKKENDSGEYTFQCKALGELVRCGECKYFIENTWECVRLSDRFGDEYSDARVYPEYYCADGERKDGERRSDEQQT